MINQGTVTYDPSPANALTLALESDDFAILVTLIETQGSSYRKAGARALYSHSAGYHGLISGGCLEQEMEKRAKAVLQSQENAYWLVDTRDPMDAFFGTGLGCQGCLVLFFEIVNLKEPLELNLLRLILEGPEERTQLTEEFHLKRLEVKRELGDCGHEIQPSLKEDSPDSIILQSKLCFRKTVVIYASGIDAFPLIEILTKASYRVILVIREEKLEIFSQFSEIAEILPSESSTPKNLRTPEFSLILMTHNVEKDVAAFRLFRQDSRVNYIGILGPAKRKKLVIDHATDGDTLDNKTLSKVFGPMGLDTGGRAPEDIAISIAAHLQCVHYDRLLNHLDQKKGATIPVLILAAGSGRRFGDNGKLTQNLGDSCVVDQVVQRCRRVFQGPIYLVLGARASEVSASISDIDHLHCLYNPLWQTGMASSLKVGVRHCMTTSAPGFIVVLGDQPLIDVDDLVALQNEVGDGQSLVATKFPDYCGAPTYIPRIKTQEVLALNGEQGARFLFDQTTRYVQSTRAGGLDIDVPDDLIQARSLLKHETPALRD